MSAELAEAGSLPDGRDAVSPADAPDPSVTDLREQIEATRRAAQERADRRDKALRDLQCRLDLSAAIVRRQVAERDAATDELQRKLDHVREVVDLQVERRARREADQEPAATPAEEARKRLQDGVLTVASLAGVLLAESLTSFVSPVDGVVAHFVLLFLFLSLSGLVSDPRRQAFFLALTIAPLIRIVSLTMPLGSFPQIYWYALTSAPLFLATGVIAGMLHISPRALNLRFAAWRRLPVDLLVAPTGILLGVVEFSILRPKPVVSGSSLVWLVGAAAIFFVCTGFLEELLFRGLILHVSTVFLGPARGLLGTCLLFGILHIGYHSLTDFVFVFLVAVYFSFVVRYTRSLLGVSMAHGSINTMLYIVLPLLWR